MRAIRHSLTKAAVELAMTSPSRVWAEPMNAMTVKGIPNFFLLLTSPMITLPMYRGKTCITRYVSLVGFVEG